MSASLIRLSRHVGSALTQLEAAFDQAKVPEAKASARHLVSKVLKVSRLSEVHNGRHGQMTTDQLNDLQRFALCRLARMPVQYIVGDWDFRGITLLMRPPVFIPRPETEQLVDIVLEHLRGAESISESLVCEVGCGSGAIALSLLSECPGLRRVIGVDHCQLACQLTLENARNLGLADRLTVYHGKLTEATCLQENWAGITTNSCDLVVSNPPYILRKDLTKLAEEVFLYEDLRALDGGADGLEVIRLVLVWADRVLKPQGKLLLEVDPCHPYLLPNKLQQVQSADPNFCLQIEEVMLDFCQKKRFIKLGRIQGSGIS